MSVSMSSLHSSVDGIVLGPDLPPEPFLRVVIFDYETAARFVLDWAMVDAASAADYLGLFLAKVHRELRTDGLGSAGHYMQSRAGIQTSFGNNRPSISYIAFSHFCELLFESPSLVGAVQAQPDYAHTVGENDFFRQRDHNAFALERGYGWRPRRHVFLDPNPISASARTAYHERVRQQRAEYEQARIKEEADKQTRLMAAKEARRREIEPRLIEERRKSDENKTFRAQFADLPLAEQVQRLAWDEAHSIRVFPIKVETITSEVLKQTDRRTRQQLLRRISTRWEPFWRQLGLRLKVIEDEFGGMPE